MLYKVSSFSLHSYNQEIYETRFGRRVVAAADRLRLFTIIYDYLRLFTRRPILLEFHKRYVTPGDRRSMEDAAY